jgi:hypothetical protein
MPSSEQQSMQHTFHHDFIATPLPLLPTNLHQSILTVSPECISLSTSTTITFAWHIHESATSSNDTIGIFLPGSVYHRIKTTINVRSIIYHHLDKLSANDVIENIYTNLNSLKIGQYHWHCTQTSINKLVNRTCETTRYSRLFSCFVVVRFQTMLSIFNTIIQSMVKYEHNHR